jgi:hypothetical protein
MAERLVVVGKHRMGEKAWSWRKPSTPSRRRSGDMRP